MLTILPILYPAPYKPTSSTELSHPNIIRSDISIIIKNIDAGKNGTLNKIELYWKNKKSICIVVASKGYPEKFQKNILINNLENFKNNNTQYIFHAGTRLNEQKFYSNGGRVLNFVSIDENFKLARDKALNLIKNLNWKNGHHRNDIGYKVIDNQ